VWWSLLAAEDEEADGLLFGEVHSMNGALNDSQSIRSTP
jgi:hypothetical protein